MKTVKNVKNPKNQTPGYRYFAPGVAASNDIYVTQTNNNDLIIGGSGFGKTTLVNANLRSTEESFVCTDVKGSLYKRNKAQLEARGYKTYKISFTDPDSGEGYDPLSYIRYTVDEDGKRIYNQTDIFALAELLSPEGKSPEPFWERATQNVIVMLISFVLEDFPEEERNMATVEDVFDLIVDVEKTRSVKFLDEFCFMHPDSLTDRAYQKCKKFFGADRTWSCISGMVGASFSKFGSREIRSMLQRKREFAFEDLGREKIALFIEVSDLDRCFDVIINILYSDLLMSLCRYADKLPDGRLPQPVRFWFDDYASSCNIRNMDLIISTVRSRNISIELILQSISQLRAAYGEDASTTICCNVSHICYLGGCDNDSRTISYIAERASIVPEKVYDLSRDKLMIITMGKRGVNVADKFDPAEVDSFTPESVSDNSKTV